MAPVRVPATVGVKVTVMLQLDAALSEVPQLFVSEKSPLATMLRMLRGALPEFVSFDVFDALVVPICWLLKVMLIGDSVTVVAPLTVRLSDLAAISELASVTCTVKLVVPMAVGVPEITPVLEARLSPAGNAPTETDQV